MITLATLASARDDEVFTQCVRHLLTQQKKSQSGTTCSYRGGDDGQLMCGAGCLISDAEADYLANHNALSYSWNSLIRAGFAPSIHEYLIRNIQCIHDNVDVKWWHGDLKHLADLYQFDWQDTIKGLDLTWVQHHE